MSRIPRTSAITVGWYHHLKNRLCSEKRIQINFPSIARTNGVARAPAVVRQFDALQSQQLTKYTMHKAGGECDCCASNRR
jgi:hypothetical protein